MNTQTQALTHTHTHLTQSLPAAIVTELTVLLSIWAATVTAAARGGCVCEGAFTNVRSPRSHHNVVARLSRVEFVWIFWLRWLEWYKHGGHVLQGLVKPPAQAGLDSAGGPSGR